MPVALDAVQTEGASTTDATSYVTASISPPADRLLVLVVYSGYWDVAQQSRTLPSSIARTGLTFTERVTIPAGVLRATIYTAPTGSAPGSGAITITFPSMVGVCEWQAFTFAGASLTDPVVQVGSSAPNNATGAPSFTLTSVPLAGSAVLAAIAVNSSAPSFVAGSGFTLLGARQQALTPDVVAQAEWDPDPAGQTVAISTSPSTVAPNKAFVAVELREQSTTDPPTAVASVSAPNPQPLTVVTLTGANSTGNITSYAWSQLAGPTLTISGTGPNRTVTPSHNAADQTYTFRLTATGPGGSSTADVSFTVARHQFWRKTDSGIVPIRWATPTGQVQVTASAAGSTDGSGTATVTWTVAPNGNNVSGVYVGREAADLPAFEFPLNANLSGSQTFTGLTLGQTYTFYVQPVVNTVRGAKTSRTASASGSTHRPAPTRLMLGEYNGAPSSSPDETYLGWYPNTWPMCTATYILDQSVNETYETARIRRGTTIFADLDPQRTPGLLTGIANRTAAGMTYINNFLAAYQRVATSHSTEAEVLVSLAHEWDVKHAQNRWLDASDADPVVYARAHSVFNERCNEIAPRCIPGYWIGGVSNSQYLNPQIMAAITPFCRWVSYDPYKSSGTQTLVQNWETRGGSFFKNDPTWVAWGRPPIYITEFGINRMAYTDAFMADYLRGIREAMVTVGITGAVYFNRNGTQDWQLHVSTPLALAAFGEEVAEVRTYVPPPPPTSNVYGTATYGTGTYG